MGGQFLRHHTISQPPAGHSVGLGVAIEDDGPLQHAGDAGDTDEFAFVQDADVDLVREDHNVILYGDLSDGPQFVPTQHPPGGVLR